MEDQTQSDIGGSVTNEFHRLEKLQKFYSTLVDVKAKILKLGEKNRDFNPVSKYHQMGVQELQMSLA